MDRTDHVILTRFNLPSEGVETLVRAQHGWLTERVKLFETYCLPSMVAQTDRRFHWLIYFDPDSPDWLMERIAEHTAQAQYTARFRVRVSRDDLASDIAEIVGGAGGELTTTNLDNDDALAVDFIERVHDLPRPPRPSVVYFVNGLVKRGDRIYRHRDPHNAYPTVIDSGRRPLTCWADWHNRLSRHAAPLEVGGPPAWLQVVHGNNVSNRIRGRLSSPAEHRQLFGSLLDDVAEPDACALTRDRVVDRPIRVVRDVGRSGLKDFGVAVLGQAGYQRTKVMLRAGRAATRS